MRELKENSSKEKFCNLVELDSNSNGIWVETEDMQG